MSTFRTVNNISEINLSDKWIPSTKFNSKNRLVTYQGRQFQIIEKRERSFSGLERFGRGFLGTLVVVCTLCCALFSKSVRNLFTKSKSNIRYAIPTTENSNVHLTAEQKKILEDFTPQMVQALGGVDKVLNFPILDTWNGEITRELLTAPVMKGYHQNGSPFLLFCYLKQNENGNGYKVTGEYLGRTQNGSWEGAYSFPSELNLRSPNPIQDGSVAEKYMLDKISRLMNGQAIGVVKRYIGHTINKPEAKECHLPGDAYLERDELLAFWNIDTLFYEKRPRANTTEVYLYDPRVPREEIKKALVEKFPAMAF